MFLSADFVQHITDVISNLIGYRFKIHQIKPVNGGDINQCFHIEGDKQSFFLKKNSNKQLPQLFILEREGLKLLERVGGVSIPKSLIAGQYQDDAFLLMSWIDKGENLAAAQAELGRILALMHKNTHQYYGLEYDNYLGMLPQSNRQHTDWSDFFIEERLKRQLEQAASMRMIDDGVLKKFELLFHKFPSLFPNEPPALLHGDLWSGNYIVDKNGTPFLIDPAVYYGHREVDLALTLLFGGFNQAFYGAYQEIFPLEKGWMERADLWNLYILLFHANVFGGNYLKQVIHIVDLYT